MSRRPVTVRQHLEILAISIVVFFAAPILQIRTDDRVQVVGSDSLVLPPLCISKSITNIDCPGCGLTRSTIKLFAGDWTGSTQYHRLGWLVFAVIAFQIPYRIYALAGGKRWLLKRQQIRIFSAAFTAALIINWLLGDLKN